MFNEIIYSKNENIGLMIHGNMLNTLVKETKNEENVKKVFEKAKSAVVYRASPSQKADVVKFMQTKVSDSKILAIGDGANDVNMI